MVGVRVLSWERPETVYELHNGRAVLVAGQDLGPMDLGEGDAALVGMAPGTYDASDGARYLKAILGTFKGGSRLRAERLGQIERSSSVG